MSKRKLTKKQQRQIEKTLVNNWKAVLAILMLVVIFVAIAYFMGWLDFLKKNNDPLEIGNETFVDSIGEMKINFLDVGQGDCIVIEFPEGKKMLIDSAKYTYETRNTIKTFFDSRNITTIDYLLLTHKDSDHVGNMAWVINNYNIKNIFKPNVYSQNEVSKDVPSEYNYQTAGSKASTEKGYAEFVLATYNEKCNVDVFNKDSDFTNKVTAGDESVQYTIDFLTPVADKQNIKYNNSNDYSPIIMLEYINRKIMFTGDAETRVLQEYLDTYNNDNNIDVLKIGHHGSKNATSQAFINAVDPEYAVIQCGKDNSFGHPDKETLNILKDYDGGVTLYRNDTNGLITLTISKTGSMRFDLERNNTDYNFVSGKDMVWSNIIGVSYQDRMSNLSMVA